MVIGKLTSYLALGLVGAFLLLSLTNPSRALATTQALGGGGVALGQWGSGIASVLTGIGKGGAKLFDPLFTLRDLIYGPQAGVQTQKDVAEVVSTTPTVNTQDIIQTQKQIEQSDQSQFTPLPFAAPAQQTDNLLDRVFGWLNIFGTGTPTTGKQDGIIPHTVKHYDIDYTRHNLYDGRYQLPLSQAAVQYYQKAGVSVSPISNQTISSQNSGNATSPSSGVSFASSGHSGSWSGGGFGAAN
jgi:hypothetical protein